MPVIPRRGRGLSTVHAQRPRRAAGPVVAWGSLSHGYVVESPGGVTFTRSPAIAMRLTEQSDGPCPGCGHRLHPFDVCNSCSCTDLPRGVVR